MAKMYALRKILRHNKKGVEEVLEKRTVFDATPAEAKQLDALNAARPAREDEVKAFEAAMATKDGAYFLDGIEAVTMVAPLRPVGSGAAGDPNNAPKSK